MYSPFLRGSANSNLFFSNGEFSHLLSPAIYLSSENESTIIKDTTFHEKQTNFNYGIVIINCTFTYCSPINEDKIADGGSIAIKSDITLEAKDCVFRQNSARKNGGAISVEKSHIVKIEGCLFAENSCIANGALHVHGCEKVDIKQSNFTLNKSKMSVGAVSLGDVADGYDFYFNILSENKARLGGTLQTFSCSGKINDCGFYKNDIVHGAASIKTLSDVILKIKRTVFSEEKNPSVSIGSGTDAEFTKCRFSGSKKDSIQKNTNVVLIINDDNEFDSNLPYNKIELPSLKPLYDNEDDFKDIQDDRRPIIPVKNASKNTPINEELLNIEYDSKNKDYSSSPYSAIFTIVVFVIICAAFYKWFIIDKRNAHRGFANLNKDSTSILNDYDTRGVNNNFEDEEMTDVKFQTNENDLPNLQMEKY